MEQSILCHHCKNMKSPHLFQPSKLKKKWPTCAKCCAEMKGDEYGARWKVRQGFIVSNIYSRRKESARKSIKRMETEALLEARRKRLAGSSQEKQFPPP